MIKYPNGKTFIPNKIQDKPKNKKASLTSANRGMGLEHDINLSNEYYKAKDIALITKRPTPINVVKVDYSHGAKITNAYFEKQSTTDYNGVFNGTYLDFEAKQTECKTSFPFSNICKHQIEHLKSVLKHGGLAFFIIRFCYYNETYFVHANVIIEQIEKLNKKSIKYEDIKTLGTLLKENYNLRVDYLVVAKQCIK